MPAALSPLGQQVKQQDHDRYLTLVFAPEEKREALFALHAFNQELARAAERVSEPLLGEMRLAWWRDAIESAAAGGRVPEHPVMAILGPLVVQGAVPAEALLQQIEARRRDLDPEGFPSVSALVAYMRETAGAFNRLHGGLVGLEAGEALEAIGTAWGVTGLLRSYRAWLAHGRIWLPQDLLAEQGITRGQLMEGLAGAPLAEVGRRLAGEAGTLLGHAHAAGPRMQKGRASPLLLGSLTELYLKRLAAAGHDLSDASLSLLPPGRVFRLTWAVLRRRW